MPNPSDAEIAPEQIEVVSLVVPRWLSFPDTLEQSFEREGAQSRSRRMWLEGLISLGIFDAFFLMHRLLVADISWGVVLIQLGLVTPMALIVNAMVRRNPRGVVREGLVAAATCVIAAVYLALQQNRNPVASAYGAVGVIVTAAFANVVMRLRFRYAISASLIILSVGLGFLLWDRMLSPPEKVMGGTLSTIAVGITLMANYSLEREERMGYLTRRRGELHRQQLEAVNAKLATLSHLDSLTGLPNRHAYEERFTMLWGEAAETGLPMSAVVVDIDHFKVLNDVRGHLYGDEVLRRVASLLLEAQLLRADFVARFGGEEFVVLLPATGREGALLVAHRIRQMVELAGSPTPDPSGGEPMMWVTVSCGVSTCLHVEEYRREELLQTADQALYEAKMGGRNMVQWKEMERPGAHRTFAPMEYQLIPDWADDLRVSLSSSRPM